MPQTGCGLPYNPILPSLSPHPTSPLRSRLTFALWCHPCTCCCLPHHRNSHGCDLRSSASQHSCGRPCTVAEACRKRRFGTQHLACFLGLALLALGDPRTQE